MNYIVRCSIVDAIGKTRDGSDTNFASLGSARFGSLCDESQRVTNCLKECAPKPSLLGLVEFRGRSQLLPRFGEKSHAHHLRSRSIPELASSASSAWLAPASYCWRSSGQTRYPNTSELLIKADCGGSNGYRVRLWKLELQGLVDELGLPISVCHLPPGASKWNTIEHRLFSFISLNWRGKPLVRHQTIIKLISATPTTKGLTAQCELDENECTRGRKVTAELMASINIKCDAFHGEWNHTHD